MADIFYIISDPVLETRKSRRFSEPICAHSISLMAPMKCGVALMSLSSETESIICPTLYQRAALRRSSFSASVAGAMVLYSVCVLVFSVFVLYCGVARRVGCFGEVGEVAGLLAS